MFDLAVGVECKDLKPKIYHGHTTIELKNVKTGIRERIESDNTFQSDVLAKYLRSFGAYNNNPYANATWRSSALWTRLVGGIYLFRDTISANSEYMPAGNLMIANGSYGVTNTSTVELGSYNNRESVVTSNSLSLVYDWTTSQGNGDINSVCLGSDVGGYIGYGNKSGGSVTGKALNENQSSEQIIGLVYKNELYNFEIDDTNLVLTVKKKKIVVTKASIFDGIETSRDYSYSSAIKFGSSSFGLRAVYMGSGKIAIFYLNTYDFDIDQNEIIKFIVFDIENNTVVVRSIENTTQDKLSIYNFNVAFNGDSIFFATDANQGGMVTAGFPIYEFNYSTGVLLHTHTGSGYGEQISLLAPNMIYFANNVIDTVNSTVYPCNVINDGLSYNDDVDGYQFKTSGNYMYKNPLYLATINNLSSQVSKDSTQTMKVVYTLTEA